MPTYTMKLFLRTYVIVAVAAAFSGHLAFGQVPVSQTTSSLPLPGCEAAPEIRKALSEKLDGDLLDKMKFAERDAYEKKILTDLMARYPRELRPYRSYSALLEDDSPQEYAALRVQRAQAAKDHPDDPLALLLGGYALTGRDTPQAIALLEAARAKAPDFPWPALQLATIYSSGKRADLPRMKQNLEAFFTLCPGSTDFGAQWMLNKDEAFQPKVAAALRARLATETDPKKLEDYATLWGLEFRTHPPKEHDAVRAQVVQDLKRVEALNPHGDAAWESFLIGGYKQSGAAPEAVTAAEDRLLHDYPHASESWRIELDRWKKAHKMPTDQTDLAAWNAYDAEYRAAIKQWISAYPDSSYLQHYAWFFTVQNWDGLSEKDGVAAMDQYLDYFRDYQAAHWRGSYYPLAAEFLVKHKWQPERALALMLDSEAAIVETRAVEDQDDNISDEDLKSRKDDRMEEDESTYGDILRASIQAGKPEEALKVKAKMEATPPAEKKLQSGYWEDRALLEQLQKHTQDALAYFQLALATRTSEPKAYEGKVTDTLKDEAQALWKQQGGTETAWAVWSKPQGAAEQAKEGEWEKATKTIPDFELSDMNGKTWKLKDLKGKTLLINLWATWCGPCQGELPQLQAFYEKNKDRKDIQILTFDIDEDLGVLAPYLKEKGFTFPVLPAYSTVVSLLDGFAIPQTWLVDAHGVWQWKQIGFSGGSEADFEKEMMTRIEAAKGGQ